MTDQCVACIADVAISRSQSGKWTELFLHGTDIKRHAVDSLARLSSMPNCRVHILPSSDMREELLTLVNMGCMC
jgi:hypothetical protein